MKKEIDQKLIKIINENSVVKIDKKTFNNDIDLMDDLGMSSLSFVSLMISIEEEFEIEIPDEYMMIDKLRKYCKLKECILEQMQKG